MYTAIKERSPHQPGSGTDFYSAVKGRRTIYGISKDVQISEERIRGAVEHAVLHTPTAFNSQSARVVLLLRESHDTLWDLTKEALRKVVPREKFAKTEKKIDSFRSGYGTVLYFEDMEVIEQLQKDYALYKDNFPLWAQQSNGILQYIVWTALSVEGLGVSLQHYNPLIDDDVRKQWNIPGSWQLLGQMPFGAPTARPGTKEMIPLSARMRVHT